MELLLIILTIAFILLLLKLVLEIRQPLDTGQILGTTQPLKIIEPTARKARVVTKRLYVSSKAYTNVTSTEYYITFEFSDGVREEYAVDGQEYGYLIEGDQGTLYTEKNMYQEFERELDA
jgi:hypothetical protein